MKIFCVVVELSLYETVFVRTWSNPKCIMLSAILLRFRLSIVFLQLSHFVPSWNRGVPKTFVLRIEEEGTDGLITPDIR